MSESRDILKEEFQDIEYRQAYAEDFSNTSIATQIRVLREQRGLTQEDLAKRIGTKQAGISRLENVNYSSWKTETLRKIAHAFDVRLRITFETFGTLLDEAETFGRKNLERYSFADDPMFHEQVAAPSEAQTSTNAVIEPPTSKLIYTVGLGAQTQINPEETNPLTIPRIGEQLKFRFPQEGITSLPFIPPWPRVPISPITGLKTRGKLDDERSVA
jgi:transcriptional regulator with XRE-family HTH domain